MDTFEDVYNRQCRAHARAAEDVARALERAIEDAGMGKRGRLRAPVVTHRVKSLDRFVRKARRKAAVVDSVFEHVQDFAGARVLCNNVCDVEAVCGIVERLPDVRVLETEDHMADPSESGYRGRHVVVEVPAPEGTLRRPVKCEIQVMTLLQNAWAEFAHDDIYANEEVEEELRQRSAHIAALLAVVDLMMQGIRDKLETPSPIPEAPAEEGGAGVSEHEIAKFFAQMSGRALTVAELPEAAETLNSVPLDFPGALSPEVWERATELAAGAFTRVLQRQPDDFEVLICGVPMAWGVEEDVALAVLPPPDRPVACVACGGWTTVGEAGHLREGYDIIHDFCPGCADRLSVCARCGIRTDNAPMADVVGAAAALCRGCKLYSNHRS